MKEIKLNSPYAWFLAARPKTLTGAIIPVLLGSALAFSDGEFKTLPALLCALFACGMQIAANFINDLFDFQKGTDRKDRLGPPRACAEGWITPGAMKLGIGCALLLSCLAGLALLFTVWGQLPHGGWELVALGVVCILFAFLYTTLLCLWFVNTGRLTLIEFIWAPCVYLCMHALTWRKMVNIRSGKGLNRILGETSRNMLFLGILLAVALAA